MASPRRASAKGRTGRRKLRNPDGSHSTELTMTVTNEKVNAGRPTNIPTIFAGKRMKGTPRAIEMKSVSRVAGAGGKDPDTGRTLPHFKSIPAAVLAAQLRSDLLGQEGDRARRRKPSRSGVISHGASRTKRRN